MSNIALGDAKNFSQRHVHNVHHIISTHLVHNLHRVHPPPHHLHHVLHSHHLHHVLVLHLRILLQLLPLTLLKIYFTHVLQHYFAPTSIEIWKKKFLFSSSLKCKNTSKREKCGLTCVTKNCECKVSIVKSFGWNSNVGECGAKQLFKTFVF